VIKPKKTNERGRIYFGSQFQSMVSQLHFWSWWADHYGRRTWRSQVSDQEAEKEGGGEKESRERERERERERRREREKKRGERMLR
jgi:hypothetical protein